MITIDKVSLTAEAGVALLSIDRPAKHNAFLVETLFELTDAIDRAAADDDVNVLVLQGGGGRVFSAGIDLASGLFEDADKLTAVMQESVLPLLESIERNEKPLIASVRGFAVGFAASIVLACDLVVMAEDAELQLVFSKLGIVPDGGACWQLVNRLGYSRALDLALGGQTLDAQDCLRLGIANRVVPSDELDDATMNWARSLAQGSSISHMLTKSLMRDASRGASYTEVADREAQAQAKCAASEYCVRSYSSFLDKRRATPKPK
ncbi:MAG: enoyl-CoA hydratase/isomerase family protein [Pseudomonadota bacterium]